MSSSKHTVNKQGLVTSFEILGDDGKAMTIPVERPKSLPDGFAFRVTRSKWSPLFDVIEKSKKGTLLLLTFPDDKQANRAKQGVYRRFDNDTVKVTRKDNQIAISVIDKPRMVKWNEHKQEG